MNFVNLRAGARRLFERLGCTSIVGTRCRDLIVRGVCLETGHPHLSLPIVDRLLILRVHRSDARVLGRVDEVAAGSLQGLPRLVIAFDGCPGGRVKVQQVNGVGTQRRPGSLVAGVGLAQMLARCTRFPVKRLNGAGAAAHHHAHQAGGC